MRRTSEPSTQPSLDFLMANPLPGVEFAQSPSIARRTCNSSSMSGIVTSSGIRSMIAMTASFVDILAPPIRFYLALPTKVLYDTNYTNGGRPMLFTPELVKARLREQPIAPLQIVTTTGQTYEIRHPDLVLVTEESLIVGLPSAKNPTIATGLVTRVAIAHVTELRDLARAVPPASNGSVA